VFYKKSACKISFYRQCRQLVQSSLQNVPLLFSGEIRILGNNDELWQVKNNFHLLSNIFIFSLSRVNRSGHGMVCKSAGRLSL